MVGPVTNKLVVYSVFMSISSYSMKIKERVTCATINISSSITNSKPLLIFLTITEQIHNRYMVLFALNICLKLIPTKA